MGEKKWAEVRPSEDYFRILNPDGSVKSGAKKQVPKVSREELLRWYEVLVETRTFEAMVLRLQRRGVLSVAASSRGEEACGLGAAAALQAGDWLFPAYRQKQPIARLQSRRRAQ
ncbi:MAG TPA: thiamine pyrophosphate-dependent enzyme, partial [Rugosibacter sp.]|nr:thiamine pyrophosphate-dependent enzyme [Rugosibacter sp.]